jgi:hypothetical protein
MWEERVGHLPEGSKEREEASITPSGDELSDFIGNLDYEGLKGSPADRPRHSLQQRGADPMTSSSRLFGFGTTSGWLLSRFVRKPLLWVIRLLSVLEMRRNGGDLLTGSREIIRPVGAGGGPYLGKPDTWRPKESSGRFLGLLNRTERDALQ